MAWDTGEETAVSMWEIERDQPCVALPRSYNTFLCCMYAAVEAYAGQQDVLAESAGFLLESVPSTCCLA